VYAWDFHINFHTAKLFFYANHIDLFNQIVLDWAKYHELSAQAHQVGGTSLNYFMPSTFTYHVLLTEYELFLNVNENNVMDVVEYNSATQQYGTRMRKEASGFNLEEEAASPQPPSSPLPSARCPPLGYGTVNNLATNTFLIFRGPDITCRLYTPYLDFHARSSQVEYEVNARNIRAHLSLPMEHPLRELVESKTHFQFLYANHLSLTANYTGHYKYNPEYRDSHVIHLMLEGAEGDAAGHFVRYAIQFKDNYFGQTTNWITRHEYAKYGNRNIYEWNRQIQYYEGGGGSGAAAAGAAGAHSAEPDEAEAMRLAREAGRAHPIPEQRMQQYMHTIQQYMDISEQTSV
jgi:hypothetical protein